MDTGMAKAIIPIVRGIAEEKQSQGSEDTSVNDITLNQLDCISTYAVAS